MFALLDELRGRDQIKRLPVILRLDRRVTERDRARLRRYEPALLPRVADSDEALAAEAALDPPSRSRRTPGRSVVMSSSPSIDLLAFGGEGIARLGDGGYVVFVAGAIPGDRVRAVVHKRKRSYAHARTLEVLEPSPSGSPQRPITPALPWQVMPYERQLEVKAAQVEEALRRIGSLDGFLWSRSSPRLEEWRYPTSPSTPSAAASTARKLVCRFHDPRAATT